MCDASNDTSPHEVTDIEVAAVFYAAISVVAIVGNVLVVTVICKFSHMRTETNVMIANMSMSDILIAIFTIPFQFQQAILQKNIFPEFICALSGFVSVISVNVSIISLCLIAIDRYFAIIRPMKKFISFRHVGLVIAGIWLIAFSSAVPHLIYTRSRPSGDVSVCSMAFPNQTTEPIVYEMHLVVVQYCIPLTIIFYCYIRIGVHIWKKITPGVAVTSNDKTVLERKKKVIRMLVVVVVLFAVCWLPLQSFNVAKTVNGCILYKHYISKVWLFCNWFAMSNCCYNPIVYGLMCERFRKAFRDLISSCSLSRRRSEDRIFSSTATERLTLRHNQRASRTPSPTRFSHANGSPAHFRSDTLM